MKCQIFIASLADQGLSYDACQIYNLLNMHLFPYESFLICNFQNINIVTKEIKVFTSCERYTTFTSLAKTITP